MRLKIKVKTFRDHTLPKIISKGDWIDLSYKDASVHLNEGGFCYLSLGIAVQLPDGFEALVVARSSTYKNYGVFNPGAVGIIDNSYCGNDDEWMFPAYALEETVIKSGSRLCQFRIQLSQKATFWQKMKWFFSSGIELVEVDNLKGKNRGGLGSTGK